MKGFKLTFIMKNALVILLSFIYSFVSSQTSDWETINISDWGIIKLPPSMEIQSGTY